VASERLAGNEVCDLSRRWILDPDLATMVLALERIATQRTTAAGIRWPGLFIISGYRSPALQAQVNPAAPNSLHTRCPSLAVDLRVGDAPASTTDVLVWKFLGDIWRTLGGKWGGDFRPTPDNNHFQALLVNGGPFEI